METKQKKELWKNSIKETGKKACESRRNSQPLSGQSTHRRITAPAQKPVVIMETARNASPFTEPIRNMCHKKIAVLSELTEHTFTTEK